MILLTQRISSINLSDMVYGGESLTCTSQSERLPTLEFRVLERARSCKRSACGAESWQPAQALVHVHVRMRIIDSGHVRNTPSRPDVRRRSWCSVHVHHSLLFKDFE